MMGDQRWWWWAGDAADVDAEGIYTHGEHQTREEAIAAILPDLDDGAIFCVIEAQFGELAGTEDDPAEFQPFAAARNHAFLQKLGGSAETFFGPVP